jgi:hypothetical protein
MGKPLRERVLQEVSLEDAFGVSEGLGSVDVLPMRVADFKGPQFALTGQPAHTVRQRAISISPCGFEAVEERRAAQKHSRIECVVTSKVFANVHDVISFASDLGGIIQVKNAIELGINPEKDFIASERLLQKRFCRFWLENVIRHEHQEAAAKMFFSSQGRNPIGFVIVPVFHKGDGYVSD